MDSSEVDEPRACYTEESQQEKGKYHMLMHIYGVYKNVIDEPIFREGMEMHI